MKARLVIDDITAEPHLFVFRGHEYDCQSSFTVAKAMYEHEENGGGKIDVAFVALAAMMNDYAVRCDGAVPTVTVQELAAWIPHTQFPAVSAFVHSITNPDAEEKVDTSELDELVDKEVPEEIAKN